MLTGYADQELDEDTAVMYMTSLLFPTYGSDGGCVIISSGHTLLYFDDDDRLALSPADRRVLSIPLRTL